MSLIPHTFFGRDWWDMPVPSRLFDQDFGMGIFGEDTMMRCPMMQRGMPMMPYWSRQSSVPRAGEGEMGMSEVVNDKDKFQVNLDVRHFKPEEITVKTVENQLVVEGRHEETPDPHGFISRHFVRKYLLPKDINPEQVTSGLSTEGRLSIQAPKMTLEPPNERSIPIEVHKSKAPAVEQKK